MVHGRAQGSSTATVSSDSRISVVPALSALPRRPSVGQPSVCASVLSGPSSLYVGLTNRDHMLVPSVLSSRPLARGVVAGSFPP